MGFKELTAELLGGIVEKTKKNLGFKEGKMKIRYFPNGDWLHEDDWSEMPEDSDDYGELEVWDGCNEEEVYELVRLANEMGERLPKEVRKANPWSF
jgi:hypothetical protein